MPDLNKKYVSTGKPKIGGYAFWAPVGSTIPTDAVSTIAEVFKSLGFISEDGVKNNNSPEAEVIKDWGGTPVLTSQKSRDDTWNFVLIESKNVEVLKLVYGDENVEGTLSTGISIKANNKEMEAKAYVFEMLMSENTKKRTVLPKAKVTALSEITYGSTGVIGYGVTLTCEADDEGNTHYEYIKEA